MAGAPAGTAPKRIVVASLEELPKDAIPLHQFAKEHNISNPCSFRDLVDKLFEHYAYYQAARGEWQRYLTEAHQQAILSWLQR